MNTSAMYVAPRTCRVIDEKGEPQPDGQTPAKPLGDYADAPALVLIAEPGAGKTTAFRTEAATSQGCFETVRRFRAFDDKPEWHDTTLFLDGLDESRAGTTDGRTPLDEIRRKLVRLGCPRFRLSCRWADWLAASDKEALKEVSQDGTLSVLLLDPLSRADIQAILARNHGVDDTDGFIAVARERGIEGLLANPQNLRMLAESVSEGEWPDTRREMFEQACRMLVREANTEHRIANPSSTDDESLIEAAAELCAVQLLSGAAGYTLPDKAQPDSDYPSVAEVDGNPGSHARKALGTRLYVGTAEGKFAPAHRQIAEFLAARHVSRLVDDDLPLQRVLELITGFDGELLPSFRNLASWLAVQNKRSRRRLSRLDASGMIYAGDAQTYSADEKRDLVLNLRRESYWNPWCNRSISMLPGIGAIVSSELETTFRDVLTDSDRSQGHQPYVMLLMQMLADGEPLLALSGSLGAAVRDPTWSHGVRCAALDVLIRYCERGSLDYGKLKGLLVEIEEGQLDDPADGLLGLLLKALYPKVLCVTDVLRHFGAPRSARGEYVRFWTSHVPDQSSPEQLAELLDGIASRFEDYRPFLAGEPARFSGLGELPVDLLDRVVLDRLVKANHEDIEPGRLYDWLGVVSDPGLSVPKSKKVLVKLHLRTNSDTVRALIVHGVKTCLANGESLTDLIDRRLFGVRPRRYGQWCLDQALAAEDTGEAALYVQELADSVVDGGHADGLSVEAARTGLAPDKALTKQFDEIVRRRTSAGTGREPQVLTRLAAETASPKDTPEQRSWQAQIADQAPALREGQGAPILLHRAAEAYLGLRADSAGRAARQRLGDLVGSRVDLIDLLVAGLEGTVERNDLPACDDVVRLYDQTRVDPLLLPFAAGLHSLEQSGRLSTTDLDESKVRLAVTTLHLLPRKFVDPASEDEVKAYRPEWFRTLLQDDTELVADVLRRNAKRKLTTGAQPAIELRELANAEDLREVAQLVSLPLLESFPKAETEAVITSLCWSLNAALTSCDVTEVKSVISERLQGSDQGPAEHACWLAAGYMVAPRRYEEEFLGLASNREGLSWLPRFVAAGRSARDFAKRLAAPDICPFVATMGAALTADGVPPRAFWVTADLINTLNGDPSALATETLEALAGMPEAQPWQAAIADATERQAWRRREHEYKHSDIRQVVRTLKNGPPANAGDLRALVLHELNDLALKIRDGSTSDWRQYWNVDGYDRPEKPKPEDACRNALLSDLQDRLQPLGTDAQPEGHYADDKRSDIRVSFGGFNVPVEIKRSCHDDLWTAVHDQLIAKYTRDPGAGGHGIYLVFWFGDTEKCRPMKLGGWTPETADDVKQRIQERLSDQEERLISVCTVDVSEPPKTS